MNQHSNLMTMVIRALYKLVIVETATKSELYQLIADNNDNFPFEGESNGSYMDMLESLINLNPLGLTLSHFKSQTKVSGRNSMI